MTAPSAEEDRAADSAFQRSWRSLVRRPSLWILLLVALAVVVFVVVRARGPVVPTAAAVNRDLEQHLVASGRVRVVTRVEVASQVAGRVVAVPVREGRRVEAGDLLVQLDDEEARAAVDQASAAVGQATARLEQLQKVGAVVAVESSRQAETNLATAEAELARLEALTVAGLVARADLDDARRAVEIARAQKAAAAAQEAAAMPLGADTQVALSARRESEAQLAAARTRLEQTRIVSPHDGVVLSRAVEPGDMAQPGVRLMELAADGITELVIEPDERNLAWIRMGQTALASADAFPDQRFEAQVCYIAPAVDPRRGSVEVRLCVARPPAYLRPDMTVSVDLTVASKADVIAVPSDAVREAATATPWVFVVDEGRIARRPVEVGIGGDGHTEIRSGLVQGDEVVVAATQVLVPGQKVRPQREER